MNKIFQRSSSLAETVVLESLQEYKRKILHTLFLGSGICAITLLGIIFILRFTAPSLVAQSILQYVNVYRLVTLLGILIIALMRKHISYKAASFLFTLLITIGVLLSETSQELAFGRSQIFLILPVIIASILLGNPAGWLVTALSSAFIIVVPLYMHLGSPDYGSIILLMLVTWLIQKYNSNLERAMIQEQKNRQILIESEDRYRKVTESLLNAVLVTDLNGKVIDCNPTAVKMYGFTSKEDLLGANGFSFVHQDERERATNDLSVLLQNGSFKDYNCMNLKNDGSPFMTDISAATITNWKGEPSSFVFMLQDTTERKNAEIVLRKSEEKFSKAFKLSPMPMVISGPDDRYVEINQAFENILEYQPEEVIGRTPSELGIFINPEQNQKAVHILREQGRLQDYKMAVRSQSGKILHGIFFAEPFQLGDRQLVLTLMNNVTEREQMEAALRQSEENYRRLIETLPIGVIVHQSEQIQLINPAGAKYLGTDAPQTLIGAPILDFVLPDHRESIETQVQDYMTSSLNTEVSEEKLVRIDGTTFDAEIVTLPVNFEGKDSLIAMFTDITERKRAETTLKKNERNFRNLTENTVSGILIVLPDGRHVYANPQACNLLGYSPEEILKTSLVDLADPAAYPQLKQRLQERLAGQPVPVNYETSIRRKDGTSFPAEVTATRTVWQDQTCDLVLFRDITERKQTQEAFRAQNQRIQEVSRQLVRAQEDEKHLLATELHDDLGQSLTSLKLMLEFSASKHATRKQQEVNKNARELVVELMDKVRNLSLDLRPAMLDDFGLFVTLRWLFERFQTQTGISIKCNYNLDNPQRFPPPVEIGAFRIIQEALTNIARHAAVKEAQVNIEFGKSLVFEIADQGAGFDFARDIIKLASTGGLSGMQERARLLGGQVQIQSKKGAGTHVIAMIPLAGGAL